MKGFSSKLSYYAGKSKFPWVNKPFKKTISVACHNLSNVQLEKAPASKGSINFKNTISSTLEKNLWWTIKYKLAKLYVGHKTQLKSTYLRWLSNLTETIVKSKDKY